MSETVVRKMNPELDAFVAGIRIPIRKLDIHYPSMHTLREYSNSCEEPRVRSVNKESYLFFDLLTNVVGYWLCISNTIHSSRHTVYCANKLTIIE